jgi:hypothetical protein
VTLVTESVPDDAYGMNLIRLGTSAVVAILIGAALPSVASAADYCVYPNTSCGPNNTQDLQQTLESAASTQEADRVLLGAMTYVAPNPMGFRYIGDSPVEIVGAGRGQSILTAQSGGLRVLYLDGHPGSSIHDLTIHLPSHVGLGFSGLVTSATARRIELTEDTAQGEHRYGAMVLEGGLLEDSRVSLEGMPGATGVLLAEATAFTGPSKLRDSRVTSRGVGVSIEGPSLVERSFVLGGNRAVSAAGNDVAVRESVLTINGGAGAVLHAHTAPNWDTNVTADGLTIFAAPSVPDEGGVQVTTAPDTARSVHLTLTNSIVRGFTPLAAVAGAGGKATIAASYSDYDPSGNIALGGAIAESHVSNVGNAGFDESTWPPYGLLPTSPLLDRGDPDAPQGMDVKGDPRVADGNGDGIARRDLGAHELQPATTGPPPAGGTSGGPTADGPAADTTAPIISGFRSARTRLRSGHGTRFRFTLSEKARATLRFQRIGRRGRPSTVGTMKRAGIKGMNRIRFTGRIGRRALRPGRYRIVATAVDATGNRSAPKVARLRIVR